MTIDWDKPLQCEINGEEKRVMLTNRSLDLCDVVCDGAIWSVRKATGEPVPSWMPRVYNAKRKPKEGEWWVCNIGVAREKVLLRRKETWAEQTKEGLYYSPRNVEPLYPLIKDPDF